MSALFETPVGLWLREHEAMVGTVGVISVIVFVLGLVLVPVILTRMPADYFLVQRPPLGRLLSLRPALRAVLVALKNVLGGVLVVAGLLMLVLPGQGVLTLLVAFMLLDVPHKRRIELWIVARAPVLRAINWIRRRASKAPLLLPESSTVPNSR